jgi:K+-transporting ATPase KdpF subunit
LVGAAEPHESRGRGFRGPAFLRNLDHERATDRVSLWTPQHERSDHDPVDERLLPGVGGVHARLREAPMIDALWIGGVTLLLFVYLLYALLRPEKF